MTIHELMKELRNHDPRREVYLSRDPEGNGFVSARLCEVGAIDSGGDFGYELLSKEDIEAGHEAIVGLPCVCIWP